MKLVMIRCSVNEPKIKFELARVFGNRKKNGHIAYLNRVKMCAICPDPSSFAIS